MFQKKKRYDLPKTVDDAADMLISDLLIQHMEVLAGMSDQEFEALYESVAPFLLAEFRLWTGNDDLLNSCISSIGGNDPPETDPAKVILKKVKEKLSDIYGVIIMT